MHLQKDQKFNADLTAGNHSLLRFIHPNEISTQMFLLISITTHSYFRRIVQKKEGGQKKDAEPTPDQGFGHLPNRGTVPFVMSQITE